MGNCFTGCGDSASYPDAQAGSSGNPCTTATCRNGCQQGCGGSSCGGNCKGICGASCAGGCIRNCDGLATIVFYLNYILVSY